MTSHIWPIVIMPPPPIARAPTTPPAKKAKYSNRKRSRTREWSAKAIEADPTASDRAIAKAANCSPHTVAKQKAEARANGRGGQRAPEADDKPPKQGAQKITPSDLGGTVLD